MEIGTIERVIGEANEVLQLMKLNEIAGSSFGEIIIEGKYSKKFEFTKFENLGHDFKESLKQILKDGTHTLIEQKIGTIKKLVNQ